MTRNFAFIVASDEKSMEKLNNNKKIEELKTIAFDRASEKSD